MATEAHHRCSRSLTRRTVAAVPEQTRTGPVYSPAVDIFENDSSITLWRTCPA